MKAVQGLHRPLEPVADAMTEHQALPQQQDADSILAARLKFTSVKEGNVYIANFKDGKTRYQIQRCLLEQFVRLDNTVGDTVEEFYTYMKEVCSYMAVTTQKALYEENEEARIIIQARVTARNRLGEGGNAIRLLASTEPELVDAFLRNLNYTLNVC